jgi:D-tyrosyl-tRNA(Tyr) deacylase
MRVVIQRVSRAKVVVDQQIVGEIATGFLILLGIGHGDGEEEASYLARKIAGLRIFEDAAGKMNLSLLEVGGAALVVSQFTLYGDARKGRRPSFTDAASPLIADALYRRFCLLLEQEGIEVARGIFQAHMQVELVNDGPVTLLLDTESMMKS